MCPIHHDVIDADPESHTVQRLVAIKAAHEADRGSAMTEPSASVVNQLLQTIGEGAVVQGSVILSNQQLCGQVAHSITNIGPQPRRVTVAAANMLIKSLKGLPAEELTVSAVFGDAEGFEFATVLKEILEQGGWKIDGVNQAVYSRPLRNVLVRVTNVTPAFQIFGNWLLQSGLKAGLYKGDDIQSNEIIVGAAM
jgi:hypothetical protein